MDNTCQAVVSAPLLYDCRLYNSEVVSFASVEGKNEEKLTESWLALVP